MEAVDDVEAVDDMEAVVDDVEAVDDDVEGVICATVFADLETFEGFGDISFTLSTSSILVEVLSAAAFAVANLVCIKTHNTQHTTQTTQHKTITNNNKKN